ncbi:MAG: AraC family transcriptional regulator [Chloroflexota bacterium]
MNNKAPATMDAHDLSAMVSLPITQTPVFDSGVIAGDLVAFGHGSSAPTGRYALPSFRQHVLVMAAEGHGAQDGKIEDQSFTGRYRPGLLGLMPAGCASEWQGIIRGPKLFLAPSLMTRVAIQTLDIDPARAAPKPVVFFEDRLLYQLGSVISRAMRLRGLYDLLYLESLSQTLAVHLLRYYVPAPATIVQPARGRLAPPVLKRVLDYIQSQPGADLTLSRLAELARLSPYHFARMFKESTGQTVHAYVLEQRLRKCRDLLLNSNQTLTQIAVEGGFADQSHFVQRFRVFFGVTPGQLRKERKIIP